jgi:drug/metabolite transporter (DMT)-like permease
MRLTYYVALILMGAAWGLVFPVTKIAVSTGYKPFGILVWQMVIGIVVMGGITLLRRRRLVFSRKYMLLFVGIACLGAVVPNWFSYTATAHLPAGIMSILIALVPLFTLPIALVMGYDTPSLYRFIGVALGGVGVVLLIGPESSLPEPGKVGFVLLGVVATVCYALEGNFMTWMGKTGLDPFQTLFGAGIIGFGLSVPLALGTGTFIDPLVPWGAAEWAVLAGTIVNQVAYVGYIWLIGRAGPVFSSQVAYLVTAFGVLGSMVILGERYSGYIWAALVLMLIGLFLVQPREKTRR